MADVAELEGWRFCPRCGGELQGDTARLECSACGFVVYASSKPTASALVLDDDGRILLARRAIEPYRGYWDLPGGFLEEGEHPVDGVRREIREETGLDIEPLEFLGVWTDRYGGDSTAEATLNFYYTAKLGEGELRPADDISDARWFAPDELPPVDEIAFDNVPQVLAAWRLRHQDA